MKENQASPGPKIILQNLQHKIRVICWTRHVPEFVSKRQRKAWLNECRSYQILKSLFSQWIQNSCFKAEMTVRTKNMHVLNNIITHAQVTRQWLETSNKSKCQNQSWTHYSNGYTLQHVCVFLNSGVINEIEPFCTNIFCLRKKNSTRWRG